MSVLGAIRACFMWLNILIQSPLMLSHFSINVVTYLLPALRPNRQWSFEKAARVRLVKLVIQFWSLAQAGNRLSLKEGKEKNRFDVIQPRSLDSYKGPLVDTVIKPAAIGTTWTPARPPTAALIKPDLVVALHFHGGAFVIGDGRDEDAGFLARTLIRHMGCTHFCTPQYRLASTKGGRFPAPLQDALTAYLWLLKDKVVPASQIILSGDSAGANIALGLLRYIHEHGAADDIPVPAAVALWSPWVDVHDATVSNIRSKPQYKTDYLSNSFSRWGARAITDYGRIDAAGPYLSPLHHPFKLEADIPMFIHAGGNEVPLPDIVEFGKRYSDAGWRSHLFVSPDCPHDILLVGTDLGFTKESVTAAVEAGKYLAEATDLPLKVHDRLAVF